MENGKMSDQRTSWSRRRVLTAGAAFATVAAGAWGAAGLLRPRQAEAAQMVVFKSPTCGCCGAWINHMRRAGFAVEARDLEDITTAKRLYGVPDDLASCHTAVIDGYVVEGHVPAASVRRLLSEKPKAAGLSVPGMPSGSPGMENGRRDPYDVVLFDRAGGRSVWDSFR